MTANKMNPAHARLIAQGLTPAQVATLRAVPTGHAPDAQGTAQDIAQALEITPAQAAARLGALRAAGLVTRDAQGNGDGVATWARFDAIAPGLDKAQAEALAHAERAAPCRFQCDALETFGPDCEAAPNGIAWRSDLNGVTRSALEARAPAAIVAQVAPALEAGRPQRAANLYQEAARHCAGHGRRERYESRARAMAAQAEAEAQERGAFGMGTAIPPVDETPQAEAQDAPQAEAEPVADFVKVIHPARVPAINSRGVRVRARLWVKIVYKGGRLSITGVEGPLSNGDALGSCGQCGVDAQAIPAEGYTLETLGRLREIWDRWHLNDMNPLSPEMRAEGWHLEAARPVWGYEFTRTRESYEAAKEAERAALDAAKAGQTFTPTPAQVKALGRPYGVTIWTRDSEPGEHPHTMPNGYAPPAPEGMERARHIGGHNSGGVKAPERKTLGWIKPSEHVDGLLGRKLNPNDSHGYGGKWWFEAVPRDVLAWLQALPEPQDGTAPAWV